MNAQHPFEHRDDRDEQPDIVAAAAAETRAVPTTPVEAANRADRYEQMTRLADKFDDVGEEMRRRAQLGAEILADPAFVESEDLSKPTYQQAAEDVERATRGKHGLLTRSIELDADALVLRATVLTYRWIDELQEAAYKSLGSVAGRAIGYLAPHVALGGAIVSAGLIETDALDRDGVAAYLNELADNNPELMEHVATGGGGLLDGLQMRALLTAGVLADERGRLAGRGGLRALGVDPLAAAFDAALRDVAGGLLDDEHEEARADEGARESAAPSSVTELMQTLTSTPHGVSVQKVGEGRYIAYLPGPNGARAGRLRLVGGDHASYAEEVVRSIEQAVEGDPDARVMLVGAAQGGVTAAEVAASAQSASFVVDQVITAGAPAAHVPRIPEPTRVLSLENSADPVALLGSLINASTTNRVTVVFDADHGPGGQVYVAGGRAADTASHPALRAEIERIQQLGYLATG